MRRIAVVAFALQETYSLDCGLPILKALSFYGHNSEKLVSDLGQSKQFLVLWCRKKHINSKIFLTMHEGRVT